MTEKQIAEELKDYTREDILLGLSLLEDGNLTVSLIKIKVEQKRKADFTTEMNKFKDNYDRTSLMFSDYLDSLYKKYGKLVLLSDLTNEEHYKLFELAVQMHTANNAWQKFIEKGR
jgi:hypothetical protein